MNHKTEAINVKMARGGSMLLDVTGRVYSGEDGSGRGETQCDIAIYWPGRNSKGKRYPVKDELIANMKEVEADFIDAACTSEVDTAEEAAERKYDEMKEKGLL